MMNLLSIHDLTVTVGIAKILDNVSLNVEQGRIVGIVGGSGSGKTTLGLSLLRLLPSAMTLTHGRIDLGGQDIASLGAEAMRNLRGKDIGMVFQEPLSAFDPLFTIGQQLDETLAVHTVLSKAERRSCIISTLASVEIKDPERIFKSYPHQLSGGLRQRAMIAQAIVCRPKLIIADEATSSLDVTIQARIMQLLRKLNREQGMTILLISHDLGMVGHLADDIVIMEKGRIVETGTAKDILKKPAHPYTKSLIEAY